MRQGRRGERGIDITRRVYTIPMQGWVCGAGRGRPHTQSPSMRTRTPHTIQIRRAGGAGAGGAPSRSDLHHTRTPHTIHTHMHTTHHPYPRRLSRSNTRWPTSPRRRLRPPGSSMLRVQEWGVGFRAKPRFVETDPSRLWSKEKQPSTYNHQPDKSNKQYTNH